MATATFLATVRSKTVLSLAVLGVSSGLAHAAAYDTAITALNPVAYYQYGTAGDGSTTVNDAGTAGTQTLTAGSTVTGSRTAQVPGTFGVASAFTPATGYNGFEPTNVVGAFPGTTIANNLVTTTGTSGTLGQAATMQTALAGASALTVSTWVSVASIPATGTNPTPIEVVLGASGSATSSVSAYQMILTTTGIRIGGRSSNTDTFKSFDVTYAAAGFTAGSLNNIVGVLDYANGVIKTYVNGNLIGTSPTGTFAASSLTFAANASTGGIVGLGGVYTTFTNTAGTVAGTASNQNFTGTQDATAIFNSSLTDAQVASLYNTAVPEPTSLAALALGGVALLRRRAR